MLFFQLINARHERASTHSSKVCSLRLRWSRLVGQASGLFKNGGEPGKHVINDGFRGSFKASPLPCGQVDDAGLVAADHAGGSGACAIERNGKAAPTREASARGNGQDD